MKPHPYSSYSNENPPYLDPEWVYDKSHETDITARFELIEYKLERGFIKKD
jgi:hypothetical protein